MNSKKNQPPTLARRLLSWFAGRAELEDIQGDLDEVYLQNRSHTSEWKADLNYWKQVFSILFSYGLKSRKDGASYAPYYANNSLTMFKNYFKIALRNFAKHKLFTTLNVFGLALGMSICLIALTATVSVHLLDEFHENKERIYQINTLLTDDSKSLRYSSTFHATGDYLKEAYPFVEEVVNVQSDFKPIIDHHGHEIKFSGYYADQAFFDVLSFRLVKGDPASALRDPYGVVLTEKTAEKLFRKENPIGKTLESDLGTLTVTGVMEDLHQTHFYFEMLASYETLHELSGRDLKSDWVNYHNHYSYVLLNEKEDYNKLDQALDQASEKAKVFYPEEEIEFAATEISDLVPVRWDNNNHLGAGWDQTALVFFIAMGILMLLPAVFNHTNLSIARSLKRAKEIGIRKVIGAQKRQIKAQFIIETILISVIALGVSLILMVPMKNYFMEMVYFSDVVDTDLNVYQLVVFILFAILVGLFAGSFPAQYFARLTPNQTLKGDVLDGKNGVTGFKKGLFVFQFFVSLVFVIGVGAISKQYAFALNYNHGFTSENVVTIPFFGMDKEIALQELNSHPDVAAVTATSSLPGLPVSQRMEATANGIDSIEAAHVYVGSDFVQKMDMQLVYGSGKFPRNVNQNGEQVLVNQAFIDALKVFEGTTDTLRFSLADGTKCQAMGILEDFNFEPLSELITPMILRYSLEKSHYALVTVSSTNIKSTLFELEELWKSIDQEAGFQATFLDHEIEEAYDIMVAQLKFFGTLSLLAITISCLGLLGMATYTTENRTKEIAVRKIMGASNYSLYYLLTKDFIKLIGISALIAIPFSYVFYDKVFLYFLIRYGSGLGATEVVLSIVFLFLVGAISIYSQTKKVTKANPATKLRYE